MTRPPSLTGREHRAETPIHGPGWAIQRMGPWVLGHWDESLTELRMVECRKLYRQAREAHGRFQVLALFRGYPFELDLLLADRARRLVLSTLEESASAFDAVICPLEGTGIKGSIMRAAAASVVSLLQSRLPIHFPSSLDDGIIVARDLGLFNARASEAAVRRQMAELEELARA